MTPSLQPLGAFAELCLHGLAHLPLRDAGSSHDPAYLAWAHGQGLSGAREQDDGARIVAILDPSARPLLHAWPRLHQDPRGFAATRRRALAELGAADVDDPATLAAIQRADAPALELFHAWLSLAHPAWRRAHADVIAPALRRASEAVAPLLATACARVPSLAPHPIVLSFVLGPRGRAHPERIIVGAPAPWHDGDAAQSVVIALHEHAVRDCARGDWAAVEWAALRRVARWLDGAPAALSDAHGRWLAQLDLRGLLDVLAARGVVGSALRHALTATPLQRGAILATHGA